MTSNKNRIDEGEIVENSCWLKRINSVEMQTSARWCKRNGCQQMTSVVPGEERSLHGCKWVELPVHRRQEKTGEDAGSKHVAGILRTFYVVPFSQGIQSTKGAKNHKRGTGQRVYPTLLSMTYSVLASPSVTSSTIAESFHLLRRKKGHTERKRWGC